ncbi:MAG: hypothetical protein K2X77_04855 [Candidatus Obscuribacterales bacterium]|nr:hypothetical protein [Candidatus Obscuribacterales bacterium]
MTSAKPTFKENFNRWFFEGMREPPRHGNAEQGGHKKAPWWQVMCLTGVDYFSTLGYQPGIAFMAAGVLSPIATLILVLLTLFGALPVYSRVAKESPHGQGSISMLEELLSGWKGKTLVLVLLGFAATDFMITMTLSAADAAAHFVENPFVPDLLRNRMGVTIALLALLGAIFLKGFKEAIGLSVFLVSTYLVLNAVVVGVGIDHVLNNPGKVIDWQQALFRQHHSVLEMVAVSALLFPKLALGLSGFETGVAVMPLIKGSPNDTEEDPAGRIANARWLLRTAAIIMSFFLIASSFMTSVLIPAHEFQHGGKADGRALSYIAHQYLGEVFGTIYDSSSIAILWFAGASAMAGLLNLVPRYLPRYGMAPNWAKAIRPLVCFFTVIAFVVTVLFKADVDAQGGAYATGVLVLMTSAAFAVWLSSRKFGLLQSIGFLAIFVVFAYTSVANMIERPDGLKIASFFIAVILLTSLISRAIRSTELRIMNVELDKKAKAFLEELEDSEVRLVAHRSGAMDHKTKEAEARRVHNLSGPIIFLEVERTDASDFFEDVLIVRGIELYGYKILKCKSPAIPNAIAALLLHVRDLTGKLPNVYMGWTEGHPLYYVLKYLFFGEGETAPITREVLREAEPDQLRRPLVHVG